MREICRELKRLQVLGAGLFLAFFIVCTGQAYAGDPLSTDSAGQGSGVSETQVEKKLILAPVPGVEKTPAVQGEGSEAITAPMVEKEDTAPPDAAAPSNDAPAAAQSSPPPPADIEAMVRDLKDRGLITEEESGRFLEAYRGLQAGDHAASPVREEYIREVADRVAEQIKGSVTSAVKEELKAEAVREARIGGWMSPLPEWTNRVTIGGDVRLRYQGDYFDDENAEFLKPSDPTKLMNTTSDRSRLRPRLRLSLNAQVTDTLETGIQITTGSTSDPVSTNATLGDSMNKDTIVLDRIYIKYRPLPELTLWGGRFANPWLSSDLVWDNDLNFEGVAFQLDSQIGSPFRGFLTLGLFPIQEVELSSRDKWLYAAQTGVRVRLAEFVRMQAAVAYYDFRNTEGRLNNPARPGEYDWTAPQFQQIGNTLFDIDPSTSYKLALASDYNELNFTVQLDMGIFDPIHAILLYDHVTNLGFDKDEVSRRTGNPDPKEAVTGFKAGLSVGYVKVQDTLEWQCYFYRKYLEADSVIDAFTDSDFHLGGTNCEGWMAGLQLGLAKNCWLETKWMTSDAIEGPQYAVDTLQVDVNVRF